MPEAFVTVIRVLLPLANVPEGPVAGAVNVTVAPAIALLLASFTTTDRLVGNAVFTATV